MGKFISNFQLRKNANYSVKFEVDKINFKERGLDEKKLNPDDTRRLPIQES